MKSHKQTENTSLVKDLVCKSFMESPVPMSITRAKDATYIEINKAAVKYMGFKRKDIIGRRPSELGHHSKTQRHLYIDEIKEQGFVKNIPLEVHIKNQGILYMFFNVYPFKMGKDSYLLSVGTDISNNKPVIKKLHDDKFLKITLQDYEFVKAKLKHYKLTPRQHEITLLSLAGHSNPEIAKKLYISSHTVKDHLKEIFRIMGVRYRSELFPKLLNLR
jgi:PAS domain S-box-containing protein